MKRVGERAHPRDLPSRPSSHVSDNYPFVLSSANIIRMWRTLLHFQLSKSCLASLISMQWVATAGTFRVDIGAFTTTQHCQKRSGIRNDGQFIFTFPSLSSLLVHMGYWAEIVRYPRLQSFQFKIYERFLGQNASTYKFVRRGRTILKHNQLPQLWGATGSFLVVPPRF